VFCGGNLEMFKNTFEKWISDIEMLFLTNVGFSKDDAMAVCQLSHSYDACFQALNR